MGEIIKGAAIGLGVVANDNISINMEKIRLF